MDNTAIQRIEQLAVTALTLPKTDIPAVALPGDAKLQSLESFSQQPARMRSTYTTERLGDFTKYVNDEHLLESATAMFVDPRGEGATCIIDHGNHEEPLWGDHRAILAMKHTPEFAALLKATQETLTQRNLTDFLEDWADEITPLTIIEEDGEEKSEKVSVARAIASIRTVDIKGKHETSHTDGNFKAARTSMEEIEAKARSGSLPSFLVMSCSLYPDTRQRDITARLSLLTGGDKPAFRLRIVGLEKIEHETSEDVQLMLRSGIEEDVRMYIGAVKR